MATAVAPAPTHVSGFHRFIDDIGHVFVKAEPLAQTLESAAVAAEPVLAFTPFGPEYDVAVNAVVAAQKMANASIAAGANLTGAQKAAMAIQSATPALNTILSSKGVSGGTETIISTWIQAIFNILAGPVAAPSAATPVVAQTTNGAA